MPRTVDEPRYLGLEALAKARLNIIPTPSPPRNGATAAAGALA